MRLLNLFKNNSEYLSWEEYKKMIIEIQVINLVNKLAKENKDYTFRMIDKITKDELAKFNI